MKNCIDCACKSDIDAAKLSSIEEDNSSLLAFETRMGMDIAER